MYYGTARQRSAAIDAFMLKKNLNIDKLLDPYQPNVILEVAGIIGQGINLQRATVVILCEPLYNPKLLKQIPKRAHRLGQKEDVDFYILIADIMIEGVVRTKCKAKSGFTADAF